MLNDQIAGVGWGLILLPEKHQFLCHAIFRKNKNDKWHLLVRNDV